MARSRQAPNTAVIAVAGEADLAVAPLLERALTDAIVAGSGELVVDLRELELIDAANVMRLVDAARALRQRGRRLRIRVDPTAHRLLRLPPVQRELQLPGVEECPQTEEGRQ